MAKRKPGELESEVLGCLWDRPDGLSSGQILALLGDDSLAITTVLTVLSRLCEKGLAQKTQGSGRTLLFKSTETREQHVAKQLLEAMSEANATEVFSHFASGLTPAQLAKLRSVLN